MYAIARVAEADNVRRRRGDATANDLFVSTTMMALERYVDGVEREYERLVPLSAALQRVPDAEVATPENVWVAQGRFLVQLHLYVVTWKVVQRLMDQLKQRSHWKAVGTVYRRHGRMLRSYGRLRSHLEHFENYLPGEKNSGLVTSAHESESGPYVAWGWVPIVDGRIVLGQDSWTLTRDDVAELRRMLGELCDELVAEAMSVIASETDH